MEGIVLRRPPHRHGRRQIRYHEKECTAYRTLNTKKTMLTYELEKLIKSLSASEKKHFQLRSGEHTSELQSLMRISSAVFCLTKKTKSHTYTIPTTQDN